MTNPEQGENADGGEEKDHRLFCCIFVGNIFLRVTEKKSIQLLSKYLHIKCMDGYLDPEMETAQRYESDNLRFSQILPLKG